MSNARVTQYQVLLLDSSRIQFLKTSALNPATLLPDDDPQAPLHDCSDILETLTNLRSDLTDNPLPTPEHGLYIWQQLHPGRGPICGSSGSHPRQGHLGQALGHGTSAKRAELIALSQSLRWAKGKSVNIYTDSRYAFATAHVHGPLPRKGTPNLRRETDQK
uniref:RNase H type-1 domain-containing protein n=1 Tax=Molossus molossus TaxID=27622 RepID=A0A7J8C8Q5_MOLMO|nr:hypothetical protein HJG59_009897 [Molossus molossus]